MLDSVTSKLKLAELLSLTKTEQILRLAEINAELEQLTAQQRVEWALENLPGNHVVSSSFGIQAALMLHLMTQAKPDIPVILTDTGYLFSETYRFIDLLSERLTLNLKVYRSGQSLIARSQIWETLGTRYRGNRKV